MSTIIDEFVVILGLDPKNFTKGQRESLASFKKTREGAEADAKGIEHAGGRVAQTFGALRGGFGGLIHGIVAGLGAHAIFKVFEHVTKMGVETGRTSRLIGISGQQLSVWRNVAERTGGTAAGITGSIKGLVTEFQKAGSGMESDLLPNLTRIGVEFNDLTDSTGALKEENVPLIMQRIGDALANINKGPGGAQKAAFWASLIGLDEPTADLLITRAGAGLKVLYDESNKIVHSTEKHTKANAQLLDSYTKLRSIIGTAVETAVSNTSPKVSAILDLWSLSLKAGSSPEAKEAAMAKAREIARNIGVWWSSTPASAASPLGVPIKPGAGVASPDIQTLAQKITSEIPGLNRFTSFNDAHHRGRGAHGRGQALDFTVKNPAEAESIARQVEEKMRAAGIPVKVTNEYDPAKRSAGYTAPHIHVELLRRQGLLSGQVSPLAAAAAVDTAMQRPAPGGFPVGAPQVGAAPGGGSTSKTDINIGTIVVHTQATDAGGVAAGIRGAIERNGLANQANSGPGG